MFLFGAKVGIAVFTPLVVGVTATVVYVAKKIAETRVRHQYLECDYIEDGALRDEAIEPMRDMQAEEDDTVSEYDLATNYNLGMVDRYRKVLYSRRFSRGQDEKKGVVEADHIPPLQSLREAPNQPGYNQLRSINPMLYEMIERARLDHRGMDQLTVQVLRQHHRNALSTGRGSESRELRLLIARRIARGEVKTLLKQCFIIAHPFSSQQIRKEAELGRRLQVGRIGLSDDGAMCVYRASFLELIEMWVSMGILSEKQGEELMAYVRHDGYLDRTTVEYQEVVDIVRRFV